MSDEKKNNWINSLRKGLSKTSVGLSLGINSIFSSNRQDKEIILDIEDLLISSDFGISTTERLIKVINKLPKSSMDEFSVKDRISSEIEKILRPLAKPLLINKDKKPFVILVVGVNGVGKTTTIGKLAFQLTKENKSVLLAAGDTFRAAAVEQLKIWSEKSMSSFIYKEHGSDSAALAYDALSKAIKEEKDILIIDTAGRLQNKNNLMEQLAKIPRVLSKIDINAPHAVLLVLDATTGQNIHSQVDIFTKVCGVTGLIVTKLDGTAKGGVMVSVAEKYNLPIHSIGVGEGIEDLQELNAEKFSKSIMGI
ncbi:signal recognition particle-docking protein FtsY [Alphaproteobacteria bacterium]|nr:signal recognition particle-docking protein FtsY [Alphaproteobacteria bacterium]